MIFRIFVTTLLICISSSSNVFARLLSSQVLSRHGTRAPNPVVEKLCPNDQRNLLKYHDLYISLAGLTANGMLELLSLGEATRAHYDGFLSEHFDNNEIFIQAVAEDRTLQSAIAWGHGLYPAGSTPGYALDLPIPLPVYSIPNGKDNLLEARKGACKERLKHEAAVWDETFGKKLWNENAALLDKLGSLCGVELKTIIKGSGDNYGDAIKDITDALMFDYQEHHTPINGLTVDEFTKFRSIAVRQLLGRIVGTNEQKTYMNGELPDMLIQNFLESVSEGGLRMYAYHGHREMLYAFAAFFGIEFDIPMLGLPKLAIPPATTLFIELHQNDEVVKGNNDTVSTKKEIEETLQRLGYVMKKKSDISGNTVNAEIKEQQASSSSLFVRVNLWVPCYANSTITEDGQYKLGPLIPGRECPMTAMPLSTCNGKSDCPLEEFVKIIMNQIQSTGDWEQLCGFRSSNDLVQQLNDANMTKQHLHTAVSLFSIAFCIAIIAAATLLAFVLCRNRMNKNNDMHSDNINASYNNNDYDDIGTYQRSNSMGEASSSRGARTNSSRMIVNENSSLLAKANSGYKSEDSLP